MIRQCPKCGYYRQPEDRNVHPGICPKCGIAYRKWLERAKVDTPEVSPQVTYEIDNGIERGLKSRIVAELLYVPEQVDITVFCGRSVTLVLFALWGISFIAGGMDWRAINSSFMHNINLPFHEFGHVLFIPLGRFMSILGGSLFQILMPLGLMVAFLIQRRDTFAASIMLWWSGQNMIDISPYIADAPYRIMPLIRGMGEEAHDWGNLLTMTNSLDSAVTLGRLSFGMGSLLIITAIAWGSYLLLKQRQRVRRF